MVMKRVEAGENVFEDLQEPKAGQSTVPSDNICENQTPTTVRKSNVHCHQVVKNSLQAYDTLNLRDQGAVMILYQMAKAM